MTSQPGPTRFPTGSATLALALGLSVLIHAGLGLAIGLRAADAESSGADTRFARFQTAEDPESLRPITLGNPDSTASSLTWIGHEEFEEMWAPESEVDQARQNPEDPGAPVEPQRAEPQPDQQVAAQTETESTEPEQQALIEPVSPTSPDEALDDPSRPIAPEPAPTVEIAGPQADIDYSGLLEMIEAIEDLSADLPRFNPVRALLDRSSARSSPRTTSPEADQATNPARTEAPAENGQGPANPPAPGDSGDGADRESDAAAANPVKNADLGKPLAAEGLNIRTVRPTFSNVTLATARPRNPVARIDFRRNGKPIRVSIIRSSGHEQVDLDIRKALYSWRASGEALLQLPDPEDSDNPAFISIKLEILL